MRALAYGLIALHLAIASGAGAQTREPPEIAALKPLRAGSRFYAIAKTCPNLIPTNVDLASRYVDLYDDVGRKVARDKAHWEALVREEIGIRLHEVEVVGAQRWCEDQRRYLEELGERKVFPRAR